MSGIPLQIISIDKDGDGDSFILVENNFKLIVQKVLDKDPMIRVSIISVVGAFRTGKSFLLNLFLRYLRSGNSSDLSEAWMFSEGDELAEGNLNTAPAASSADVSGDGSTAAASSKSEASFAWRGGKDRQTTGIWMWSEPFFRPAADGAGDVAVLLMDTQGMFDHETSMTLTAKIFGLSTFVSSFQIYNVDKQIQEDNLQHLALFSEYGKMAHDQQKRRVGKSTTTPSSSPSASADLPASETAAAPSESAADIGDGPGAAASEEVSVAASEASSKPFQRLQFLVRDWQNFESELEDGSSGEELDSLKQNMIAEREAYMQAVLQARGLKDLQSTRDQINRCFEEVKSFLLPHPGFAVTNKKYNGSISAINPFFRFLVNCLVREVFDKTLVPKTINEQALRGLDVLAYFQAFVSLFAKGSNGFPEPQTILDATSSANNRTSLLKALHGYKTSMTTLVQDDKPYLKPVDFQRLSDAALAAALLSFDEQATMGSESAVASVRAELVQELEEERVRFAQTNALKNPLRDLEKLLIPIMIAGASWVVALLLDFWCSSHHCEALEDTFENIYMFIAFGILMFAYMNPFKDAVMYSGPVAVAVAAWFVSAVVGSACDSQTCQKLTKAFGRVYIFVFFAAAALVFKHFRGNFSFLLNNLNNVSSLAQAAQSATNAK